MNQSITLNMAIVFHRAIQSTQNQPALIIKKKKIGQRFTI
jgi:hypothetical protein